MDTGGLPGAAAPGGELEELPDPLIGRNVGGKFVLEKLLGAGAMGAVYRARQTALEKVVAVKVMHGGLAQDPMFAARFHREAKAAARLDHPNSIRMVDYGQDAEDGLLYIAMEFLSGRDLAHLIVEDWPLSNARLVDLLSQALGAIAVAHDLGITHRDLKPENIMVLRAPTDDGGEIDVVKVCDFGIAKIAEGNDDEGAADGQSGAKGKGKLTTAGLVIGTPAYMSPEQGRGEVIDGRSDIYSTGVILFQLLTGELPFDAPSAIGLVVKHQTEAVPPPSSIRIGVDPGLEAVCLKALEKKPADRYQNARAFRSALRTAVDAAPDRSSRDMDSGHARIAVAGSKPHVAIAETELQLVVAPTGAAPATTAPTIPEPRAAESPPTKRWPIVVGGVALALIAGVVGVITRTPSSAVASTAPPQAESHATAAPAESSGTTPTSAREPTSVGATGDHAGTTSPDPDTHGARATELEPVRRGANPTANGVFPNRVPPSGAAMAPTQAKGEVPKSTPPEPVTAAEAPVVPPVAPVPVPAVAALVPTPPVPAIPAAPAPPAYDVQTASVAVGKAINLENGGANPVNEAISRVSSAISRCYTSGLPSLVPPLDGSGKLHIETDDDGVITGATVSGPVRGRVSACIERAVNGSRLGGGESGHVRADIPLEFKAR